MRMTIYVGDELKKRIAKVKEPVSWSAVASEAFEFALACLAAIRAGEHGNTGLAQRSRTMRAELTRRLRPGAKINPWQKVDGD